MDTEANTRDEKGGQSGPGTLYVVSTPIGNLEDITLRALRILKEVDLIAAESVEHTRALCRHFGIETRLTGYNQHNQGVKGPALIRKLQQGSSIALVTNAGTPGVSDPGVLLARQAAEGGIRISPVPGPSAVTAALSVSGMRGESFVFCGFLSSRAGKRRGELKELASEKRTLVFFEAPHRIEETLQDLQEVLGDRPMLLIQGDFQDPRGGDPRAGQRSDRATAGEGKRGVHSGRGRREGSGAGCDCGGKNQEKRLRNS